ncbi:MAG: glycosyl hydrolase [Sphingobacteriales bacterium]|nr:glycosyl hydrolase [Sphingobacteriales bacterium]
MFPKLKEFIYLFTFSSFSLTINAQVNPTSAEERLKGLQQRKVLEEKSVLNSIKFRNIGPAIMSGRVVDIDANPDDPTEFYVAYATGGLWHTTNNGQSFTPVFDSADVIGIGDIAVNWLTKTIWVGTGEVNSSRSSYSGIGVYKSSDAGKHWDYLGLPESHHIGKIQLHPTDNNIAWVAVLGHLYSPNKERGVYKTTDGGKTWKQTLFVDDNTGAVDIDINPSNLNELYAAMWYRVRRAWKFEESGKTSGLFKSSDGGETWKLISAEGSGFMTGNKIGRIGVAVYPKNPNIVYAVVDNYNAKPDTAKKPDTLYKKEDFKNLTKEQFAQLDNKKLDTFLRRSFFPRKYTAASIKDMVANDRVKSTAVWDFLDSGDDGFQGSITGCEVYRSDDGGITWKKTHTKDISIYSTYGYYFGKIYVSPVNENKVFITGVPLQMSADAGKTFKTISKRNVHADHHALWINPNRDSHMINGNDGGCNITYDNGENWFFANTPPVGQFYSVTTDDDRPYNIYGGLQDNNVWYGPSTYVAGPGWQSSGDYPYKSLVGGDGMQVQVDTRDNTTTYAGSQFGVYSRMNRKTKGDRKSVRPIHELGEKPLRFNWQTPIMLSRHNQDIFYIGANRLYRSMNKGDTLIGITSDLTNGRMPGNVPYGTLTTLSESPLRFGMLYAGTDDGNIHLSKDAGYSWTKVNVMITAPSIAKGKTKLPPVNTIPGGLWVSRIIASQHKEARVYATLNGYRSDNFAPYLFVSDDYGSTWKQLGKDLPAEPLNVVREDPKNDSILYVGSDGGLYVSFDQGNSFMMWNGGLPKSVPVHDIAIQVRENDIILGTHGRSLYVSKLTDVQGLKKDPEWLKKKPKPKEDKKPTDDDDDGMEPEK